MKRTELPAGFEDLRRDFQGRYALDDVLHATALRVTFGGCERDTGRDIVLDVVRPSPLHDQATVERFERRIAASRGVRHPALHSPTDAGELVDGKFYTVCERPSGEPLDRHLKLDPAGRLDWAAARLLLLELARGLAAAHTRRVVHGSLSPGCCWVDRSAFGVPSLRVLGFGVNTGPSPADEKSSHSRTNVIGHDAVFMAPESAGGLFGDEQSDVYMAGLVAWFMLVGAPPFQGTNPFQLASMHMTTPVPAMRESGADVPASVDALVWTMLAKQPQQRPCMAEVAQALYDLDEGVEGGISEGARGGAAASRENSQLPTAPARDEHTVLLAAYGFADASTLDDEPETEGTMVLELPNGHARPSDSDEDALDSTMMLPWPDTRDREGTMLLPHDEPKEAMMRASASSGTVPFTADQVRRLRTGVRPGDPRNPPDPTSSPAVTGRTQRMSPDEVRALRQRGLSGRATATPTAGRGDEESEVEATQMLNLDGQAVPELAPELEEDIEEAQTHSLSRAELTALQQQRPSTKPRKR